MFDEVEYQRKYREKNKEKLSLLKKKYYKKNRERVLDRIKKNSFTKKEEISKYHKKYYLKNKENILKYQKDYRQKFSDKIRENKRVYYQNNRTRFLVYQKIQGKIYSKSESGKLVRVVNQNKRRITINDIKKLGSFTKEQWVRLKEEFYYTCPICYKKEPEIKLTVDHIIPISKGGKNTIENIQPLCISCNSSKGIKTLKAHRL